MAALSLYCPRQVEISIDGAVPSSAQLMLPWGHHVLTFRSERLPREGALLVNLMTAPKHRTVENKAVKAVRVVSTARDGLWRYTTQESGAAWQTPDFDDSRWSVMTPAPPPVTENGSVPWMARTACHQEIPSSRPNVQRCWTPWR